MEYSAIVIALVSLALGVYTAIVPLSRVNSNMSSLANRTVRAEVAAETGLILSKIISVPWATYKLQAQQEAAYYHASEFPVKRQADGTYSLTSAGEALIEPQLRETIVGIRGARTPTDDKTLILELGVQTLVKEALSRELPPGVMMGTLITFLEAN